MPQFLGSLDQDGFAVEKICGRKTRVCSDLVAIDRDRAVLEVLARLALRFRERGFGKKVGDCDSLLLEIRLAVGRVRNICEDIAQHLRVEILQPAFAEERLGRRLHAHEFVRTVDRSSHIPCETLLREPLVRSLRMLAFDAFDFFSFEKRERAAPKPSRPSKAKLKLWRRRLRRVLRRS